jgi:hypothetical protein
MANCGLTLPCEQAVSLSERISALQIDNTGTYGGAITGKNTVSADPAISGVSNDGIAVQGATQSDGIGVQGITQGAGTGVQGIAQGIGAVGIGVAGQSDRGTGVSGESNGTGVYGLSNGSSSNSIGVLGWSGSYNGVMGHSGSNSASGVYGENNAGGSGVTGKCDAGTGVNGSSTTGFGAFGISTNGHGIVGSSTTGFGVSASSVSNFGVFGDSSGHNGVVGVSAADFASGVLGVNSNNDDTGSYRYGVAGIGGTASHSVGVLGSLSNGSTGYAGYFTAKVHVVSLVNTARSGFKIDHPLEPDVKYLNHSSVESPDLKNVYDGVATLDSQGSTWVELPSWFEALNRDFRYQLTPIGSYAPVYIAKEIANNRFQIAGGKPGQHISWLVTGIRSDVWAKKNPISVEEDKDSADRGKFLHPLEAGHAWEMGIPYSRTRGLEAVDQQREKMKQEQKLRHRADREAAPAPAI